MTTHRLVGQRRWMMVGGLAVLAVTCSMNADPPSPGSAVAQGPSLGPLNSPGPMPEASPVPQATRPAADHPLTAVLTLAKQSRDSLKTVKDYECQFAQRDVVNGKMHAHATYVKYREAPMSIYMRFGKPHEGREVIYVAGMNGGNLLAHESGLAGLVGTVPVQPNSPRALSESRHPITEFGMKKLVDGVIAQWENEAKFAANETEAKYYPQAKLYNAECQVIETRHPVHRRQFPFYLTRLYIDKQTQFPVRMEQYGWPERAGENPPLLEEYTFYQITVNRGFDDRDFDPRNPAYGF